MEEALKEFLVESFDGINEVTQVLTELEKKPHDSELVNSMYRNIHTMKGSASFFNLQKIKEITHTCENLIDEIREKRVEVNPTIIDLLLKTADTCLALLKSLEETGKEDDTDYSALIAELEDAQKSPQENSHEISAQDPGPEVVADETTMSDVRDDLDDLDAELNDLIEEQIEVSTIQKADSENSSTDDPNLKNETPVGGYVQSAAYESLKELVDQGLASAESLVELINSEMEVSDRPETVPVTTIDEPHEETSKADPQPAKDNLADSSSAKKPVEVAPTPSKPSAAPAAQAQKSSIIDSVVRVNVQTLDRIMNIVGELVLNRNQIVQLSGDDRTPELNRLALQLNTITTELQSEVMSTRMQPVGSILNKYERLVRDFSRKSGKEISLNLVGQETELDKTLLDAIKDPLVHIVRNACDHGIETPEEREASGKSGPGVLTISAYNESGQVTIDITDNGRGLNKEAILAKAIEKGVLTQEESLSMRESKIYDLIFAPGFSTAKEITDISGRGVGMDVVKTNIEKIGGSVSIESTHGVGTTFKLRIPLTLAIVPALIVRSQEEEFAIPQINLVELVRVEEEELHLIEKIHDSEFLRLRGKLTPLFRLDRCLNLQESKETNVSLNIAIVTSEANSYGIIVDEILDTSEIVVKALGKSISQIGVFGGATIMGDGKVALIIDPVGFLNKFSPFHDKHQNDVEVEQEFVKSSEFDEHLVVLLDDQKEYALKLSEVNRLEEFKADQVEQIGETRVVQYLNKPMPLISLSKEMTGVGSSEQGDVISCVVIECEGELFGLEVKEILDISYDQTQVNKEAVDSKGFVGIVRINERNMALLDTDYLVKKQSFYQKNKSEEKNDDLNEVA